MYTSGMMYCIDFFLKLEIVQSAEREIMLNPPTAPSCVFGCSALAIHRLLLQFIVLISNLTCRIFCKFCAGKRTEVTVTTCFKDGRHKISQKYPISPSMVPYIESETYFQPVVVVNGNICCPSRPLPCCRSKKELEGLEL